LLSYCIDYCIHATYDPAIAYIGNTLEIACLHTPVTRRIMQWLEQVELTLALLLFQVIDSANNGMVRSVIF
jgi:hypothetical protein